MKAGAKRITQAMREFLLWVDPTNGSQWAEDVKHSSRTKRACASRGWVDWNDRDVWPKIYLTEDGRDIRQMCAEVKALEDQVRRMIELGLTAAVERPPADGMDYMKAAVLGVRAGKPPVISFTGAEFAGARCNGTGTAPAPLAALTCGRSNTDSFAAFLDRLNAAGKNRWKDPRFMGERPARRAQLRPEGK